jgi:hypothetical protein
VTTTKAYKVEFDRSIKGCVCAVEREIEGQHKRRGKGGGGEGRRKRTTVFGRPINPAACGVFICEDQYRVDEHKRKWRSADRAGRIAEARHTKARPMLASVRQLRGLASSSSSSSLEASWHERDTSDLCVSKPWFCFHHDSRFPAFCPVVQCPPSEHAHPSFTCRFERSFGGEQFRTGIHGV